MQCPKCHREKFEVEKPCASCGFRGNVNQLDELGHLQWLLSQMEAWEAFEIDPSTVSKLREIHRSRLRELQVELGLRLPAFTPEKVEKAWMELAHLETLFDKVEEWRDAGYFNPEMGDGDPVRMQRALAEELRQRLDAYQRPALPQRDPDRLKTVSFLMDQIDLLSARGWFKSKKEIEKVVAPLMAVMLDVMSDQQGE
jgi:hypothetical protein